MIFLFIGNERTSSNRENLSPSHSPLSSEDEEATSSIERVCNRELGNAQSPETNGNSDKDLHREMETEDPNPSSNHGFKSCVTQEGTTQRQVAKRSIQLLDMDDAPLPRFAAKAQSRNAVFKQPKSSTLSSSKQVQSRISESPKTSPKTMLGYSSREEQIQMRKQKLKQLNRQPEKDSPAPSPKIKAQPKVKYTSRNRNQGLVDSIMGVERKESEESLEMGDQPSTSSVNGSVNVNQMTTTRVHEEIQSRPVTDPRLSSKLSMVVPRDPTLKPVGNRSLISSKEMPKDNMSANATLKNLQQKDTIASKILKPGAKPLLSPPPGISRVPDYPRERTAATVSTTAHRMSYPPAMPEEDIYRRILCWRPIWLEV